LDFIYEERKPYVVEFEINTKSNQFWFEYNNFEVSIVKLPKAKKYSLDFSRGNLTIEFGTYTIIFLR
jgi:hypothetical protein